MKKILVTGASGFVGCRFVARWRNEYSILTPTHAELDITDRDSVNSYFMFHTPEVVVHLAALSNTDYCEQNPEESCRVNVASSVAFGATFPYKGRQMRIAALRLQSNTFRKPYGCR